MPTQRKYVRKAIMKAGKKKAGRPKKVGRPKKSAGKKVMNRAIKSIATRKIVNKIRKMGRKPLKKTIRFRAF